MVLGNQALSLRAAHRAARRDDEHTVQAHRGRFLQKPEGERKISQDVNTGSAQLVCGTAA